MKTRSINQSNMEARPHLVSGSVFKTDEARSTPGLAGSIPVRFRHALARAIKKIPLRRVTAASRACKLRLRAHGGWR
jgi:hypothetical protein